MHIHNNHNYNDVTIIPHKISWKLLIMIVVNIIMLDYS